DRPRHPAGGDRAAHRGRRFLRRGLRAFGSKEKTLHANLGGHTGTPWFELEDGCRFFDRHLK
ncbi:hypothetical protein ACZ91_46740, partial [Streptomyces regensis]